MNSGAVNDTGPQRTSPGKPSFAPYDLRQFQERHLGARATIVHSQSTSSPSPETVLITPHPLSQFISPPTPVNKLQENVSTSLVLPLRRQIEQVRYVPARNQGDFAPTELISFSTNGFAGFSVARAVAKEFAGLDGRDQGVSSFEGNKVIFRIQFRGYDLYSPKINTRRHVAEWAPITRCKLAMEIGKRVKDYIEKRGLQEIFALEGIYLTRLFRVSKGSWQAELWCEDSVAPGPSSV